jgi:hypothetical protein
MSAWERRPNYSLLYKYHLACCATGQVILCSRVARSLGKIKAFESIS